MAIVVDNFAGGGGASTAMEQALGRHVDIAINHDLDAIRMHKRNHPSTEHYCESVWDVSPSDACRGRAVDVAWFSPDCKHFSRAAGGTPKDKNIRALAWVVLRWAALPEWQRPRLIFLENVSEFLTWRPVTKSGAIDNRYAKGSTFREWVRKLKIAGYVVEWRELRADDYGAPTIRKRLFLVARCDGLPIIWPAPTHGNPRNDPLGVAGLKPWKPASSIIDWAVPSKSIFERDRPLAENTMRRIAAGINKFVIKNPEPFIVKVNHTGNRFRGQSLKTPLQTVTGKLGSMLLTPYITKFNQNSNGQSLEMPLDTVMAGATRFSAISPIIQHVAHTSAKTGCMPANEPMRTITATPKGGSLAVTTAYLAQHNKGAVGRRADAPLSTTTQRGTQQQLVEVDLDGVDGVDDQADRSEAVSAFLLKYYGNEKSGCDIQEPLHTVTSKDRFALVIFHGQPYRIVDIRMRMLTPRELFNAQGFPADYDIMDGELPKTAQVAKAGNAVSPPPAIALIRANAQPYMHDGSMSAAVA